MLLVMFQVKQGIPGINPQVFLPRHGNKATFSCVFTLFKIWITEPTKNIQANLCGFIRDNKQGPLNKCANFH